MMVAFTNRHISELVYATRPDWLPEFNRRTNPLSGENPADACRDVLKSAGITKAAAEDFAINRNPESARAKCTEPTREPSLPATSPREILKQLESKSTITR